MKSKYYIKVDKVHRFLVEKFLILAPFFYGYVFFTGHDIYGHGEIKVLKDVGIMLLLVISIIKIFKKRMFKISILSIFVIILLIFSFFVLIKNPYSLSLKIFRSMIEYNLMFFIVGDIFLQKKNVLKFIKNQLVIGLVISLIGIIEYSLGGIPTDYSKAAGQIRIISTLFNPNALGWYLCIVSLMIISLILKKNEEVFSKKILSIMLLFFIISIFLSGSRSSIYVLITISTIVYLLNNPTRLIFNIIVITILIYYTISLSGIDFMTFRIIASGLETERFYIISKILDEIAFMRFDEIVFGSSSTRIIKLDKLGLLYDSQIIIDFILGGLFYIIIKYLLLIFTILYLFFKKRSTTFDILFATLLMAFFLLSFLGNVTTIFPHAILFWTFLRIGLQNKTYDTHKNLSQTAISI